MAKHRTKVVLTCSGPSRMTTYNEEINEKIEGQCRSRKGSKALFEPTIAHCMGDSHCPFLETKTYK